jgi:DNA topoisomerase III
MAKLRHALRLRPMSLVLDGRYAAAAPPAPAQPNSVAGTPLRIPYGNKDVAMKLGARYGSGGWYAPPGLDLSAFGERGWL